MQQIGTQERRTIAVELLPLIDERATRTTRLAALGWEGFVAANRRSEDDWCDTSELALHHRMVEESLKESRFNVQVYCSCVLHEARKRFVGQYAVRFGNWGPNAYVTPVTLAQTEDERGGFVRKWEIQQAYTSRLAHARKVDLARVSAPLAPALANSADAVFALIEAVQAQALAGWGFQPDKAMAVKHGPVFSRPLRDQWKLATTLVDRHLVYPKQFGTTANGHVSLALVLAQEGTKVGNLERALSHHPERILILPLAPFINLREQDPAVTAYLGGAELEAKVRFQCDAMSVVLPDLIPALERALSFIAGQS